MSRWRQRGEARSAWRGFPDLVVLCDGLAQRDHCLIANYDNRQNDAVSEMQKRDGPGVCGGLFRASRSCRELACGPAQEKAHRSYKSAAW